MNVTMYHNPRCSKSRATLALLRDRGIDPTLIDYQQSPPGAPEIASLCKLLGVRPLELIRTGDDRFQALGLDPGDDRTDTSWCEVMAEHPELIERPIVLANGKAALGRPPTRILEILS